MKPTGVGSGRGKGFPACPTGKTKALYEIPLPGTPTVARTPRLPMLTVAPRTPMLVLMPRLPTFIRTPENSVNVCLKRSVTSRPRRLLVQFKRTSPFG